MYKTLLHNENDYKDMQDLNSTNDIPKWFLGKPDKYPCLALFEIRTSDNGWDYITGDFIYLDDFEDYVL
jgi:hypothetical protein